MKESFLKTSLRSFLMTFFGIMGLLLGLIPVMLIFGLMSSSDKKISQDYSLEILPNASGVRKKLSSDAPVILQLNFDGVIGLEKYDYNTISTMLAESREGDLKNDRVKGILLHINSPGGGFSDADNIYKALKTYKARFKVPVYAYVDGLCASGGMYIACAADKVYASDVSLIGSVGVITTPFMNFYKLLDKVGVETLTLYEGKGKDELSSTRPWKEDEAADMKNIIKFYYKYFVDVVSSNRGIDPKTLVDVYGAHVFPAEEALSYRFIDGIKNSKSGALLKLLEEIGIEDDYYQLVQMNSTVWYKELFQAQSPLFTGKIKHELVVPAAMNAKFSNQYLLLYHPEGA